ncbi:MAG TPA: hypothetical protein VLA75_13475 [Thermoanaerobaculia bacterium]|nr:hypothetical protein [Thermoanaerobaculia bacterium]
MAFEVAGAYAFPALVGLGEVPGTRVAISNAIFQAEFVDRLWLRERAINRDFVDEETAVAYLEFDAGGAFLGATWYFGPGTGCGFCREAETASTVALRGGRLAGRVTARGEGRGYEVTLDLPVAPELPGREIARDGGEAGRAYLAWHAALAGRDWPALLALVEPEERPRFEAARAEGLDLFARLGAGRARTVRIVRAFAHADWVTLLVEGEGEAGRMHGEARLRRQGGAYRFHDELFDPGDWPEERRP